MSPELETLDQLIGGDLPLGVIRGLFPSEERFTRGIMAMLEAPEVRLVVGGTEVHHGRWHEIIAAPAGGDSPSGVRLGITRLGAKRIG